MGVGLVIFWPSLFFIGGDKVNAAQLAHLKGEMDAIQQVSIQKQCGIQFRTTQPPASAAAPAKATPGPASSYADQK
jgi:hypothetical protein